jgi:hypothetical protein
MKTFPPNSVLPSYFSALRFVGEGFGVGEAEMKATLKRMRKMGKRSKKRNQHFPRRLTREMLSRAERGVGKWSSGLITVAEEALYDRIRRKNGQALFGVSGSLADRLTFALLRLYQKIVPRLNTKGVSAKDALWVMVEDVFLPTLFVELALNWQRGLGTEFQLETCWYLPVADRGERLKPTARVLKCWFRAAGFRYTHDFTKEVDDSFRKKVDGWLKGVCPRNICELHELVERFADDVRWLDSPESWIARFTLARAMQKFCDAMDGFFAEERPDSSLKIVEMLRSIQNEGVPVDGGGILADRFSFFSARLLKRRLEREGRWEPEVMALVTRSATRTFSDEVTDDEIEQFRREIEWSSNAGNWFVSLIEGEVGSRAPGNGRPEAVAATCLQEQLLDLGIVELNRILDAKRGRQANAHRP